MSLLNLQLSAYQYICRSEAEKLQRGSIKNSRYAGQAYFFLLEPIRLIGRVSYCPFILVATILDWRGCSLLIPIRTELFDIRGSIFWSSDVWARISWMALETAWLSKSEVGSTTSITLTRLSSFSRLTSATYRFRSFTCVTKAVLQEP